MTRGWEDSGAPQLPGGAAPRMSERDLQRSVIDTCHVFNLLVYHTLDSRGSSPGFPDLVVCGPQGVLFVELKSEHGNITRPQGVWRDGLMDAGATWHLWRPEDWHSGQIITELRALCARVPSRAAR